MVGAAGGHRVVCVGNGHNPGAVVDFLTDQALRIAGPIPSLVMVQDGVAPGLEELLDRSNECVTQFGVFAHLFPLIFIKGAVLVEDWLIDTKLADVMQ